MTDLQRIWGNILLGDDPSQTAPVCNGLVQEMIDEIESLRKVKAQAEQVVICDSWRSEECYDELWKLKEMLEAE